MALTEKSTRPGEVFIELPSPAYCLETVAVENSGEVDITLAPGQPMVNATPTVAAGLAAATLTSVVYEEVVIPAGETVNIAVVARGPAVINGDKLPATDYAGAALTLNTLITKVGALPDVVVRRESELSAQMTG